MKKRHEFTEPSNFQVSSLCTYTQHCSILKLSDLFIVWSKLFFVNCSVNRVRFLHVSSRLMTRLALLSAQLFTNYCVNELIFCCDPLLVPDFTFLNHIVYGQHPSSHDTNINTAFLFLRTVLLAH